MPRQYTLFHLEQFFVQCKLLQTNKKLQARKEALCLAKIPSACVFIAFQLARVGRSRRLLTVKISRRLFNFLAGWSFGEAQVRNGQLEKALRVLAEKLHEKGLLDLDEGFIDGSFASAKKGASRWARPSAAKGQRSWPSPLLPGH
jgi:hypothetical protein